MLVVVVARTSPPAALRSRLWLLGRLRRRLLALRGLLVRWLLLVLLLRSRLASGLTLRGLLGLSLTLRLALPAAVWIMRDTIVLVGSGATCRESKTHEGGTEPSEQRPCREGAMEDVHRFLLCIMLGVAPAAAQSKRTALTHSTGGTNLPKIRLMESLGKTRPAMTQALFDSLRSLACITGYLGQYLAANAAFTAALGWTEEELRGFAYYELAPPAERQFMIKLGSDIIRNVAGEPRTYQRPMRHKDGGYRLIEWTVWADSKSRLVYATGQVLGTAQVE